MLDEAKDIPQDEVLRPLMDDMHPDQILHACRQQLSHVDDDVRSSWKVCRVVDGLYHPGRYLRMAYVLLADPDTPAKRQWPEGQIVYLHGPMRLPLSRRGRRLVLNGSEAEVYCFPNDRRLRELRQFTGRQRAADIWQTWITQSGDDFRMDPDSLRRVLIRYVPEQKWVARLRVRGVETGSSGEQKRSIAVRAASKASCAVLARRHACFKQSAGHDDRFGVPSVIGTGSSGELLAVEWARGKSLTETLDAQPVEYVMSRMTELLEWFHGCSVSSLDTIGLKDVLDRAHAAGSDLSAACPSLRSRIDDLIHLLHEHAKGIGPAAYVALHNDFHWNQVRIKEAKITVLDLERMCKGDPLLDVANFAVQLRMLGHRRESRADVATAEHWARQFLCQWEKSAGTPIEQNRFACYAAVSLLNLARGMMRHLRPGWMDLASRCLQTAEEELSSSMCETR